MNMTNNANYNKQIMTEHIKEKLNQKLIAYSIDPDISNEEGQAIIEMVQAAKKFRRRI